MEDKQMERYGALAGIGFVVLNVVGMFFAPSPPAPSDSEEKIFNWFVDNDSGIRTATFLGAISIVFMLWFLGTLWRHMSKAEGGSVRASVTSAAGLVGAGALWMVAAGVQSTIALLDGAGAKGFYTLSSVLMGAAGPFLAAHLLGANLLALRTKWLPSWIAGIGLLGATAQLVGSAGTMTDADWPMYAGMIGFLAWCIWIIASGLQMYRKPA
jgi:hypothetical protein